MVASSALAQPSLQLEVKGSPAAKDTCLRAESLRARITHYMGSHPAPPNLRVVIDLALDPGAELRIFRDDALLSRRRFPQLPAACEDRRDAVSLTIALALEDAGATERKASATTTTSIQTSAEPSTDAPTARTQQQTASEREATSPSPVEVPQDTTPVVLATMPSSISHTRTREAGADVADVQLQLGARWLTQALPFPLWLGSLGVAVAWLDQRVSIALSTLASTTSDTSFASGRASGRLYGLEAMGCSSFALGASALELCVGATAAACDVKGRDYPVPLRARSDATLLWAAGIARVGWRWPAASSFGLRVLGQGHFNVSRPALEVERAPQRLQPGWVGLAVGLELVVTLP